MSRSRTPVQQYLNSAAGTAALLAASVLLRLLVGLASYSGAADAPKYGDYEAQRHWMEITINTPVKQWYTDGPNNNMRYWPLDYPPLSGYQSWLHGQLLKAFEKGAVALGSSGGYETYTSKQLMRWTVLLSDIAVFFPAALLASRVFCSHPKHWQYRGVVLAALLLQPALLLIDHAHFQYNCISLGLVAGAAAAVASGQHIVGSVLYCLALNHKQMSLYFAPAFFGHLLGRCLERKTLSQKVSAVAALGITVISTFALCWAPYMSSPEAALKVVQRIFPVGRGLYEDYVANFWCTTSVLIKWKTLFSQAALMKACMLLTVLAALPSMVQQIRRPSTWGLLLAMANSSLAFYTFAYQVHEKSILLALLPITMMAAWEPELALWGQLVACFSMYPLLERDGAALPYLALQLTHVLVFTALLPRPKRQLEVHLNNALQASPLARWTQYKHWFAPATVLVAALLHIARMAVPAPDRYPWFHDRAFISFSYVFITGAMVYLNWRQYNQEKQQQRQERHVKAQ